MDLNLPTVDVVASHPIPQASPFSALSPPDPGQAALLFLPTPSCPWQDPPPSSSYSFCPSGGGASVQACSIERDSLLASWAVSAPPHTLCFQFRDRCRKSLLPWAAHSLSSSLVLCWRAISPARLWAFWKLRPRPICASVPRHHPGPQKALSVFT